jgi:hypothetical protein
MHTAPSGEECRGGRENIDDARRGRTKGSKKRVGLGLARHLGMAPAPYYKLKLGDDLLQKANYFSAFSCVQLLKHLIRYAWGNGNSSPNRGFAQLRQTKNMLSTIQCVGLNMDKTALLQPTDHLFNGGAVQKNKATKFVLRAKADLQQLGHGRELDAC